MSLSVEEIVLQSLNVSMSDYMSGDVNYYYWEMYEHSLQLVRELIKNHGIEFTVRHMNLIMSTAPSFTGRSSAIVDIATTLESLAPEKYAGAFKYP